MMRGLRMSDAMHTLLDRLAELMEAHHRGGLDAFYTIVGNSENGYVILTTIKDEVR